MIFTILLKEIQYNLLNARLIFAWGILILLFVISAFSFSNYLIEMDKNWMRMELENNKKIVYDEDMGVWDELRAKYLGEPYNYKNSLYDLVFIKQVLLKKNSSISLVSTSLAELPNGIELQYFKQPVIKTIKSSNIYMDTFNTLNWCKIFINILSFVIICFSFNAFSGEKEKGTLKLMLANNVPRISIILGKFIGLLVIFLIPLAIGMLTILLLIITNPNLSFYQGDSIKLFFFVMTGLTFISINILLGYFISCLSQTSSKSLSVSLTIWVILAIIFPSVSWLGVNTIKPIPTIAEVNNVIESLQAELNECYMAWDPKWIGKSPNQQVMMRKECIDRKTKIENEIWSDYYKKLFLQTEKGISIASISPFSSFQFLCDKIMDSGYFGYRHFYKQVQDYQDEYKNFINTKDKEDMDSFHLIWDEFCTQSFMSDQKVNATEVPHFEYHPPSISLVIKNGFGNILYLSGWFILLLVGVYIAFFRYDVR